MLKVSVIGVYTLYGFAASSLVQTWAGGPAGHPCRRTPTKNLTYHGGLSSGIGMHCEWELTGNGNNATVVLSPPTVPHPRWRTSVLTCSPPD